MTNLPIELNLEVSTGDDYLLPIVIKNKDGITDADFSNYDGFFTLKTTKDEYLNDDNKVYQLSTIDGDFSISTSGTPLQSDINIPTFAREERLFTSNPLPITTYYWDFQLVSPSGKVKTWYKGKYKTTWNTTRRVN